MLMFGFVESYKSMLAIKAYMAEIEAMAAKTYTHRHAACIHRDRATFSVGVFHPYTSKVYS